jgi:protein-S-isoprenylcysteine O-methyltransferase Ste14
VTATSPRDNPGVVAPPPLIALAAIAIGFVLEWAAPVALPAREARWAAGAALILAGFAVLGWAIAAFRSAGTNVQTQKPSNAIASSGPYRLSRNPIYLAMAAALVGIGLAAGSAWVMAMIVPFLLVVRSGVIAREERYLEGKFGDEYRAYRARVGRWL